MKNSLSDDPNDVLRKLMKYIIRYALNPTRSSTLSFYTKKMKDFKIKNIDSKKILIHIRNSN